MIYPEANKSHTIAKVIREMGEDEFTPEVWERIRQGIALALQTEALKIASEETDATEAPKTAE